MAVAIGLPVQPHASIDIASCVLIARTNNPYYPPSPCFDNLQGSVTWCGGGELNGVCKVNARRSYSAQLELV